MMKHARVQRSFYRFLAVLLTITMLLPMVAAAGAETQPQLFEIPASNGSEEGIQWYSYVNEDFSLGGDGTTLASGILWERSHTIKDGELLLKNKSDAASVGNFSAAYPDQFILKFRAKANAAVIDGDWAVQMQVTPTSRLMLKSNANGTMTSCTASATWANTIQNTPNDTQWHDYRLELNKTELTAKFYIDNAFTTTINLQIGGYTNPMLNFFKDSGTPTVAYVDDVQLLFPIDASGAPIWTPAQKLQQTAMGYDSITVSWNPAIGEVTNYLLYKGADEAIELAGNLTSYTFSGLPSSTGYTVRVEAKNENGVTTGGPSAEVRTKYNPAHNGADIAPFWTGGVGGYGSYRIPGIVVTSKDTVIAYCEARRGGGDWDPMDLVIRRSTDHGETWSENHVLIPGLDKGITVNNPVIIVDNDGETLHMLYCVMYGVEQLNGSVYYMKSVDDGVTWSEPRDIGASCYPQGDATFTDRNVIATGPGHAIQLKNDTLIVPVWMTDGPKSASKNHQPSVVSTLYSTDKGETWKIGEIIHRDQSGVPMSNPNETTAVELSDGRVMLNIRRQYGASAENPNYRIVTISSNGFSNWSKPYADTQLMDAGNGCFGSLVRYNDEGTILFTNAEDPTARRNVTVKVSCDDGATWVAKKSLDPSKTGSAYSDIAVDSQGVIYDLFEVGSGMKLARFNMAYLTKPFAPKSVTAEDIAGTTANISWSRSPDNIGTASYNLYLGESNTPINNEPITQSSYALTGLTVSTAYTVRVVELCQVGGPVENNHSDPATVAFTTTATAAKHAITIAAVSNGLVTSDKTEAAAGDQVALTITPNSGYRLKADSLKASKTGESAVTVAIAENKFVMPDYDVTVTAEFEQVPPPEVLDKKPIDDALAAAGTAKTGVIVSESDPSNVSSGTKFVTAAVMDALTAAIDTATAVKGTATTNEQIAAAAKALTAAVTVFTNAIQTGTYVAPSYNPPSSTTTTTKKNEDGSTTKTVTDKRTGTVTETTTKPNGDKTVVETKKDGTVTEKVTNKDGYQSELVTKPDGSFTGKATDAKGVKTETTATVKGEITAKVTLPRNTESAKVTVPAKNPKPGTVVVIVKADGTEEIIKTSVVTKGGVLFTAKGDVTVKLVDNSKSFADLGSDHWAAGAIQFVTSRELFNGTGKDSFTPGANMSRAMLITVLARLDGQDTTKGDTWYAASVDWAKEQGLTDGIALEDAISREQLAVMLYRYAKAEKTETNFKDFTDAGSVSAWAVEAMSWAVNKGIIAGKSGTLDPHGTATRAEVAAMLQRFISL